MRISHRQRNQGSTLLICLVACSLVGIVLASYLTLVSNRFTMSMRSKAWNEAMPVLEAGIEEAMTHLQEDSEKPLTANGWLPGTLSGQTVYTKLRTNSSDGSYFFVQIYYPTATNPIIYSSGFVPSPVNSKSGYISRTVKVTTSKPKVFNNAIAANGPINMNGTAMVDSYSSCLGPYSSSNSLGTNGSIASDGSISLGNANVYGTVTTGASGTLTVGSQGGAGDDAWNASKSGGVEPGWSADDMDVYFPSNPPPAGGPFLAPTPGTNVTYLTGGTNQLTSLSISSSSQSLIVTAPSVLYITGAINISGNGYIQINSNASLTIIMGGNASFAGNGIINSSGVPENLNLVGLNGCTSVSYSGGVDFYGTINAPEADMTLGGTASVYGAAIVNSFSNKGTANFHFDSCLDETEIIVMSSWQEIL